MTAGSEGPSFRDPRAYERLRELLAAAKYTHSGLLDILLLKDLSAIREDDREMLLLRTAGGSPLETLTRLFLVEVPVETAAARRAFAPMALEEVAEAGLVRIDGESVEASVKLLPFHDLLVAFDLRKKLYTDRAYDYVMGVGESSLTLSNLTVRGEVSSALDLGTGCGFQAMLLARHCGRVVATDRNTRAVRMAAFNAALNGLSSVDCREGDLFGPVEGERFDRIVSNPPFVISPEMRYVYRDGGMAGDEICRAIVGRATGFLEEGGFCQLLCNWAERTGRDWSEELKGWVEGTGCDVWALRSETRDAAMYASTWIRHTEKAEAGLFPRRFAEWMDYYKRLGIESVGMGIITLRRRSGGGNWFRADEAPAKVLGSGGDAILDGFARRDFLEGVTDDAALLGSRFLVSRDALVRQEIGFGAEGAELRSVSLQRIRGLAFFGDIDIYMFGLLKGCDGQRTLGELFLEMCREMGADPKEALSPFCRIVRKLIERDFLVPALTPNRSASPHTLPCR